MKSPCKLFRKTLILLTNLLVATTSAGAAEVVVGGSLVGTITFVSSNVYHVTNTLIVPGGAVLIIELGTEVRFDPNTHLRVEGTLIARGTPGHEIRFTSSMASPFPGSWGAPLGPGEVQNGIAFVDGVDAVLDEAGEYVAGSIVEHAIIEYGTGLSIVRSAPLVRRNLLRFNEPPGSAVLFFNGNVSGFPPRMPSIVENIVQDSSGLGFNVQQGAVRFERNLVVQTGGGFIGEISGTFVENSIVCNRAGFGAGVILFAFRKTALFRDNTFFNPGFADVELRFDAGDHDLSGNYWGTTDPAAIANRIIDIADDPSLQGRVTFEPVLSEPDPDAPESSDCSVPTTNTPPVANAGADQMVECSSTTGTPVTLDGSASSDPDGDPLRFEWKDGAGNVLGTTASVNLTLPLATHTFTLTVDDGQGGTASDSVVITVQDTVPPMLGFTLAPNVLFPPNHELVEVTASIQVSDLCDPNPSIVLVSIISNEPDDGLGDGDTRNDIQGDSIGTDDRSFFVRAERGGIGTGRIYTVRYRAMDASGNMTFATGRVTVPHD